jgi:hypothetical protein
MASGASLSDLLTALQSDTNYGTAGFDLSLDTANGSAIGLKLSWTTAASVPDLASASILDNRIQPTLYATQTQAGSQLNTNAGTAEIQRIAITPSKLAEKNIQIRVGDFEMFSGRLDSQTSLQQMIASFKANTSYELAPFTLSEDTPGYLSVSWKNPGVVNQLAVVEVLPDNPLRSLMKRGDINSKQSASFMTAAIDVALQTLAETKNTLGVAGVQLTASVEKLASSNSTSQRSLNTTSSSAYAKSIASLLRFQMSDNSLQAAWAQASLSPSQVANTLA